MPVEEPHRVVCHLDELLAAWGMTLAALAEAVGVTVVNLSVLKNNRAKAIRYSTLTAICDARLPGGRPAVGRGGAGRRLGVTARPQRRRQSGSPAARPAWPTAGRSPNSGPTASTTTAVSSATAAATTSAALTLSTKACRPRSASSWPR
ncbi:MAG: helix-turn-helix domain-containing protein [Nocardioides sp.]